MWFRVNRDVDIKKVRPFSEAGIAIGPILFVIAILGILATAIASTSGGFTASTDREAADTKANAIIQIGSLLKSGVERMGGSGYVLSDITINPASTTASDDLFSPTGGGVNPPATTLAENAATDTWLYPYAAIPTLGTSATERLAVLKVTLAVCDAVNRRANNITTTAETNHVNDVGVMSMSGTLATASDWPVALQGLITGCIRNSNTTTSGYYYYQVLGIR